MQNAIARALPRRFGVFNLVASAGFVVQMTTLSVLIRVFGWPYWAATLIGVEFAIVLSFLGHHRWTWSDRRPRGLREWRIRAARYQGAKGATLAINLGITALLVTASPLSPEGANVCAVGFCSIFRYAVSDRAVFTT